MSQKNEKLCFLIEKNNFNTFLLRKYNIHYIRRTLYVVYFKYLLILYSCILYTTSNDHTNDL